MTMIRMLAATVSAALISLATPAAAQTVEQLQGSMEVFFAGGSGVTIRNSLGKAGSAGHWHMVRRVTGATSTERCFTRLETPTVVEQTNSRPVGYYGINWAQVRDVRWSGDRHVHLQADHMASGESSVLSFASRDDAEMLHAVFLYLAEECGGM
ncbi:hypothetical protein [Sphingosinithalassobacter sp. CS137]|uniref:hypothetical protein n=1 Tax=Sphingosinithalassobacter sp. CS137 TaxID=2762748 RepID=UPI00165E63CF|nr:hypothetical protein [Sphingosinithalassobacter sp. CS137]